jgi:hypothetical protein
LITSSVLWDRGETETLGECCHTQEQCRASHAGGHCLFQGVRSPMVGFYPEHGGRNFATDPELDAQTSCRVGLWLPIPGGMQQRWPLLEGGSS